MKTDQGFTLTELAVGIGMVAVLATIALPQYNIYVARQQAAESLVMMNAQKGKIIESLMKTGKCTTSGSNESVSGKYGTLVISGTATSAAILNTKALQNTGCLLTYTVNTTDTSKMIQGKTIIANLFNNGSLSKNTSSSVEYRLIPKSLIALSPDTTPSVTPSPVITTSIETVIPPTTPTRIDAAMKSADILSIHQPCEATPQIMIPNVAAKMIRVRTCVLLSGACASWPSLANRAAIAALSSATIDLDGSARTLSA